MKILIYASIRYNICTYIFYVYINYIYYSESYSANYIKIFAC